MRRRILETIAGLLRASGRGVKETIAEQIDQTREEIKAEVTGRLQKLVKPK